MVKQRMDLLELLRKRGMDGDVDFLREALRVLVDGIMDAEVSAQIGAQHGERSPERAPTAMATATAPGIPGWAPPSSILMELHIPKVREGSYFPSLLEPTAAQREGSAGRHPASLRRGRVHPAGG